MTPPLDEPRPLGPAILFCPADRPERYAKAAAVADAVIIDLEDAVAPADKPAAREALAAADLDPATTIVRLNSRVSGEQEADLAALHRTAIRTVMLAKAESPAELEPLAGLDVIALCESPLGIRNAGLLADQPGVTALFWGPEDLVAGLGGSSSRRADGRFRDVARFARSQVLIAAASAGKPAYDTVYLDIADLDGLRGEAQDAAASGFVGTVCIHPRQVEVVRAAYRPALEAVAWAQSTLELAGRERGVFRFEGRMIDEPVLRQARRIIASASITPSNPETPQ